MNDTDRVLITFLAVLIAVLGVLLIVKGLDLEDTIREQQTIHKEYRND